MSEVQSNMRELIDVLNENGVISAMAEIAGVEGDAADVNVKTDAITRTLTVTVDGPVAAVRLVMEPK